MSDEWDVGWIDGRGFRLVFLEGMLWFLGDGGGEIDEQQDGAGKQDATWQRECIERDEQLMGIPLTRVGCQVGHFTYKERAR